MQSHEAITAKLQNAYENLSSVLDKDKRLAKNAKSKRTETQAILKSMSRSSTALDSEVDKLQSEKWNPQTYYKRDQFSVLCIWEAKFQVA